MIETLLADIVVPGGAFGLVEHEYHCKFSALGVSHSRVVCIVFFHNHHFVVMFQPRSAVRIVFQMFICKQAFFCSCVPVKKIHGTHGIARE